MVPHFCCLVAARSLRRCSPWPFAELELCKHSHLEQSGATLQVSAEYPWIARQRFPRLCRNDLYSMFRGLQSREEIVEQRVVNSAALRMVLDTESERIVAQAHLLDNAIMCGPRLHFQVVA